MDQALGLSIETQPFDGPEAAALVALAEAELGRRYGPGPHDKVVDAPAEPLAPGALVSADQLRRPLRAAEFARPGGTFLVARLDGWGAVGCAGLRPIGGAAEVKRLYVRPEFRRRGIAQALMDELVSAAPALGHRRLVLETGELQPEAVALYDSTGWTRISSYFGSPRHSVSVYFERWVAPQEASRPPS